MTNHKLMKAINRAKVLNAIRLHRPLSRSEIARRVSLDKKSITNFTDELLAEDMIREAGKRGAARGRPHVLLDFNPRVCQVIGIGVSAEDVTGVRIDFQGKVLASREIPLPENSPTGAVVSAVKDAYCALKAAAPGARTLGAGIAIPGVLDLKAGVVRESVNLPALKGFAFVRELSAMIAGRMRFEEASRAKALAEKWFGLGRRLRDFVVVDLGIGVGAGIVNDRRLYRGAGEHAGEIGHVVVNPGGKPCRCGNKGCLEAYISERTVLEEIRDREGRSSRRLRDIESLTPGMREILRAAGRWLGRGIAPIVNIINPASIILNGSLVRFEDAVMPGVREGLRESSLAECVRTTEVLASNLEKASALGAAAAVLSDLFEVEGHYYV